MIRIRKNIAISDSGFVFDPSSGESFSLNAVGLEIVQHIKSGSSFYELAQSVTGRYDVDTSTFERYYYDFLASLKHLNLLEPDGNG